ncbi:hypothetical protein BU15DRAFT_59956 [Melanogaster broomeanus]|nr:hypothetical protein BU15DRAFT_59956 [Melanogaster broomeanus]
MCRSTTSPPEPNPSPVLSTDKLRPPPIYPSPFIAAAYFDAVRGHRRHVPIHAPPSRKSLDFLRTLRDVTARQNSCPCSPVIGYNRPPIQHPQWEGSLAGLFGLLYTDKTNLVTEIGPAIVLPAFQRTHVASHAVGLILKYLLDIAPSGLGFRKVKWTASPFNVPSNRLAKRMGFKFEGLIRWTSVVVRAEGYQKDGKEARAGDAGDGLLGRDSNELAVCWDDWEGGGRELVEQAFARVA